jgi:hypothetical protein
MPGVQDSGTDAVWGCGQSVSAEAALPENETRARWGARLSGTMSLRSGGFGLGLFGRVAAFAFFAGQGDRCAHAL